jgi:hypothetical protein
LVVLQYRQHKAEFRVVWVKPLDSGTEQQIGLEADAQRDMWGLEVKAPDRSQATPPALAKGASIGA